MSTSRWTLLPRFERTQMVTHPACQQAEQPRYLLRAGLHPIPLDLESVAVKDHVPELADENKPTLLLKTATATIQTK